MIGHLTGKLASKKPTQILLDVNGVGYIINISLTTFEKLPELNEQASLVTYLSVKEDSMDLFGFSSQSEKEMFLLLISVSGIGPKLGLATLSGIPIDELKQALLDGNISRLVAIPGIGRKTAERLLVELRDKVEKTAQDVEFLSGGSMSVRNDAVVALTTLGYNQKSAEKLVRDLLTQNPNMSIEDLIKEALQTLNK